MATTAQQLAFWRSVLPVAQAIHAAVPQMYVQTLLAQMGDETGYNAAGYPANNLAGISPGGRLARYRSRQAFVRAYVTAIRSPLYARVRAAEGVAAQLYALGASAWASGHYNDGAGPGSALAAIYQENRGLLDSLAGSVPVPLPFGGGTASIPTWLPVVAIGVPLAALAISDLRRL